MGRLSPTWCRLGCCVCVCEVIWPHSHGWHLTGCPQGSRRYLGHVSFIIQQASPGSCTWWQFLGSQELQSRAHPSVQCSSTSQASFVSPLLLSHQPKQAKEPRPHLGSGGQGVKLTLPLGKSCKVALHRGRGARRGGVLWLFFQSLTIEKAAINLTQRTLGRLPRRVDI